MLVFLECNLLVDTFGEDDRFVDEGRGFPLVLLDGKTLKIEPFLLSPCFRDKLLFMVFAVITDAVVEVTDSTL